ncbi:MAG: hypothetical protein QOK35_2309 [Pseudonocardiales bacterium]|nr:hypothetical protein [Pseudonocardiales bacterium]
MQTDERPSGTTAVTSPETETETGAPTTPDAPEAAAPPRPRARRGPSIDAIGRALLPAAVYLAVRSVGVLVLGLMAARGSGLVNELRSWDGVWMLAIAARGYDRVPPTLVDAFGRHTADTAYAFFPGYPATVAVTGLLTGGNLVAAALLVSAVAGVIAAYGLVALAGSLPPELTPGGPRRVGLLLVALFAAAPMGVVLSMAYTEALFCALAVWALVGALRERWLLAGLCAAAGGLVRPTSSALALAVVLAALVVAVRARSWRPLVAAVLAPIGLLGYLAFVGWRTGSPTGWFAIQRTGWGSRFDGGASLATFVGRTLTGGHEVYDLAVLLALVGSVVLLVLAVRMRVPWPLLVYATAVLVTVWASDGQIHSRVRLLMPAFPLLLPIAVGLARRRTGTAVAVVVAAALASAWFGGYTLTIWRYAV